jgi:hypothetical protein
MSDGLGLDAWWDEREYKQARLTFVRRGAGLQETQ